MTIHMIEQLLGILVAKLIKHNEATQSRQRLKTKGLYATQLLQCFKMKGLKAT
jgi:hypothetical protein